MNVMYQHSKPSVSDVWLLYYQSNNTKEYLKLLYMI